MIQIDEEQEQKKKEEKKYGIDDTQELEQYLQSGILQANLHFVDSWVDRRREGDDNMWLYEEPGQ